MRRSSPQTGVLPWGRKPQVFVCAGSRDAAARCAIEESGLNQERLVNVLNRVFFLMDRCGQAVEADRTAAEFFDDRAQQPAIELVEPAIVHFEELEGGAG